MMRGLIPALMAVTLTLNAWANPHYLLLPETLSTLSRLIQPEELLFSDEGVSLLKVDASRIETFSDRIHEERKACGGFIDVTKEIDNGKLPSQIVWSHLIKKHRPVFRNPRTIAYRSNIATLVSEAKADEWLGFLNKLTAFPDRSATTEEGVKAAKFLKELSESIGFSLGGFSARLIMTGNSYKQPSVVATLVGSKPNLGHVVLGGHMDTFSNQKPGADDDGSGSATVLEILRSVAKAGAKFERTIHFAWYAAEERGLVGSSYVVDDFKDKGIPVDAVIQFDMTGYKSNDDDKDIYVITDYTNESMTTELKKLISLYTSATIGETACGYACSDHANWHLEGFPAVFPFEASFENMNHRLHTADDTTTYLDKNHALYFVQAGLAFVGEMANLH